MQLSTRNLPFRRLLPLLAAGLAITFGIWAATLVNLGTQVQGTLPAANGGTGQTTPTSHATLVGNGSAWNMKVIPDCQDSAGNHLNYTQGSDSFTCGTSSSFTLNFADMETPSGAINGINATFTLAHTPSPLASLTLYLNGVSQQSGAGNDYTISGATITMLNVPQTGDKLLAWYRF